MGGQVGVVHVTVLGDRLAACLAARFASVAVPARGVGVALGSGGPTPLFFVFLGWGACARDRAEGGRARVSGVGVWAAPAWTLGGVIGRVSGCVSVGGCVSWRLRGLAACGAARASVGGLLLAFARVAGGA